MVKDIKIGQKFLSRGREVEIVCVSGKSPNYPVIDDYGDSYTENGCFYDYKTDDSFDLQPIPATIVEGVEFSGEQYRQQFNELVEAGREFECDEFGEWVKDKNPGRFDGGITYRLISQHRDAVGNPLKVGDRVECEYGRAEIIKFLNQRAFFKEFGWKYCYHCRLLKTVTRPLRLDDLEKAPCPMMLCSGVRVSPVWTEKYVWVNAYRRGYDELEDIQWRPSADKPWQPCEVAEEVFA